MTPEPTIPNLAGVVLCGGSSRRMGQPKLWLSLGRETLLQRVVNRLLSVASPVVVVAAESQDLPELPRNVELRRDRVPGQGPLEGLFTGLSALQNRAELVYVSGTDTPFLQPAWVRALTDRLGPHDLAVPEEPGRCHLLSAVYRRAPAAEAAEALLQSGERRLQALLDRLATQRVPVETLRADDPHLLTLRNLNTPEDYAQALRDLDSLNP